MVSLQLVLALTGFFLVLRRMDPVLIASYGLAPAMAFLSAAKTALAVPPAPRYVCFLYVIRGFLPDQLLGRHLGPSLSTLSQEHD